MQKDPRLRVLQCRAKPRAPRCPGRAAALGFLRAARYPRPPSAPRPPGAQHSLSPPLLSRSPPHSTTISRQSSIVSSSCSPSCGASCAAGSWRPRRHVSSDDSPRPLSSVAPCCAGHSGAGGGGAADHGWRLFANRLVWFWRSKVFALDAHAVTYVNVRVCGAQSEAARCPARPARPAPLRLPSPFSQGCRWLDGARQRGGGEGLS